MLEAIGLIEWQSIAIGYAATDILLKTSNITLLEARPTCPGRFYALITGDVASVKVSIEKAENYSIEEVIDKIVLPNAHPTVLPAITGRGISYENQSLGIVETFTLSSCLNCADMIAKSAAVELIEIRLGIGLAGKSIAICCGEVAAVSSAVNRCPLLLSENGNLVAVEVIAAPHKDLYGLY